MSVTKSRSFSRLFRASRVLPSTTTRTSNSSAGNFFSHRFVLAEFRRVGPEQLRQRIVDLDPMDAEHGADDQDEQDDAGDDGRPDGEQPDALQPEGDRGRRPLLDLVDMNLTLAVLFEHALSSS
ncbi:hypothetical protein ACVWWO_008180 [Bradyrhizobium sp. F1.13.1]